MTGAALRTLYLRTERFTAGGLYAILNESGGSPAHYTDQPMTLREAIESASRLKSGADSWINIFNWLTGIGAVVAAPFTMGLSLLCLLAIPYVAVLGATATYSARTARLMEIQLQLMADERGLR